MEKNKGLKSEKRSSGGTDSDKKLLLIVFIFYTSFLLLRFASSFFPQARLWGFNQAAFVDWLIFIYPVLFGLGLFFFIQASKQVNMIEPDTVKSRTYSIIGKIFPYAVIVISGLCFYLFDVYTHFLGDGYLNITSLSNPNLGIKPVEYGEVFFHRLYINLFSSFTEAGAIQSYRNLSFLGGLIFVVSLVYYGKKVTDSFFSYCIFILLSLLSAFTLLFFGYVEHYSLTAAFAYLFLLSAVYAIKFRKRSVVPIIAFIASVFLHNISIVYLPAFLVFVLILFVDGKALNFLLKKVKYIAPVLIVLFIVFYFIVRNSGILAWQLILLPVVEWHYTIDGYTLLSLNHIIDYLNLLLFLAPVLLFVIILYLFKLKPERNKKTDREMIFLITTAVIGLLSAFVIEPKLGMARDWDLMSVILLGVSFTGIYLIVNRFRSFRHYKAAMVMLVLINISIFIPWLSLHNSTNGLFEYTNSVLELDPKHGRNGFWILQDYADKHSLKSEAKKLAEYNRVHFPEVSLNKRGLEYLNNGNVVMAENIFRKSIAENPHFSGSYRNLAYCLFSTSRFIESLSILKIADAINSGNSEINYLIGMSYLQLNNKNEALKYLNKSKKCNSANPDTYLALGYYYYANNQPDSALHYYTCLPDTAFPVEIYYHLGLVQLLKGDKIKALSNFDKYLSEGADSFMLEEINKIKKDLK